MLFRSRPAKVFYYGKPVDFRKQAAGLAAIVDLEFKGQLQLGYWFVFFSADKKKVKILYWRGNGFALWQLRLKTDLFSLGKPRVNETRGLSWRDLGRLLDGYNIFAGDGHTLGCSKIFA